MPFSARAITNPNKEKVMSKFTTPIFTVEAPGPIILAGVISVVAGSVAKLWIRRHGWNVSHPQPIAEAFVEVDTSGD